jgi:hypothetical protein
VWKTAGMSWGRSTQVIVSSALIDKVSRDEYAVNMLWIDPLTELELSYYRSHEKTEESSTERVLQMMAPNA